MRYCTARINEIHLLAKVIKKNSNNGKFSTTIKTVSTEYEW